MQRIHIIPFLVFLFSLPLAGQTLTDLPISHPVYDDLDRLETRRIFAGSLPGIRPYSRSRISEWIARALKSDDLPKGTRERLNRYTRNLSINPVSPRLTDGFVYAYDDTTLRVSVSPLFQQNFITRGYDETTSEQISHTLLGLSAAGSFHHHFAFRIQHFEGREWSNHGRLTRSDVARSPIESVQLKGNTVDFRESRYQLRVTLPWLDFDVGKESFEWGPARENNIFLQARTPSFVYSRFRVTHRAVSFQHIFGALRTPPDAVELGTSLMANGHRRTLPSSKRFVAHRIGLAVTDRLNLGIHESVIYGDRAFEPAYAIPISILVGAQSYAGDTDNLAIGVDLSYRFRDQAKLYVALFLDDLSKFSPSAFSNQLGIQVGAFCVDPLGLSESNVRIEYVRLEPYTYAHNYNINAYTHFDEVLGHPLGPNSDRASIEIQGWPRSRLRLSGRLSRTRQGDNYLQGGELVNVGGDASQGRRPKDPAIRSFLAGNLTETTDFRLDAYYEAFSAMRFRVSGLVRRQNETLADGNPKTPSTTRSLSISTELNAF